MHYRFTRDQRVLTKSDFDRVFSKPTSRVSNKYLLLLARQDDEPRARLGLVMSKKNVGNAIKRNRIKRLCRECFRQQAASLPSADLVLLARPGISKLENNEISLLIQSLFDKLRGR